MSELLERVKGGIILGAGMACMYAVFVIVVFVFRGAEPFEAAGTTLPQVLLVYFAGGIGAGALVGALLPLTRYLLGAVVVYSLTGFFIFTSIAITVDGIHMIDWFGCAGLGSVMGTGGGFMLRQIFSEKA